MKTLIDIISNLRQIITNHPVLHHIAGNVYESEEGEIFIGGRTEREIRDECETYETIDNLREFYDRQGIDYEWSEEFEEDYLPQPQTLADVGMHERDFW